jgi:DNA-binding beta-propeller fold protein YncE
VVSAVVMAALAVFVAMTPANAGTRDRSQPAGGAELVYVANADSGPVTAYAESSSGAVTPVRRNLSPNDPNTYWDPWGVAFDAKRFLYVQTFLSDATSFVFGPRARGRHLPARIFMGGGPDTRAIAVDGLGYEYIATGEGSSEIDVLPPGANGDPNNLYEVPPIRTIQTDEQAFFPWPDILATDAQNELLAAIVRSPDNAAEVFQGGPFGAAAPVRVISGPETRLGSCPGFGTCDQMSVAVSALTGRIYVAVSAGTKTRICEFAGDASGDVAPVRIIRGASTRLAGRDVTGIAVSPSTGEIYVMVKRGQFGPGEIDVFARGANGDVAPERTFSDAASSFTDAQGIAIRP